MEEGMKIVVTVLVLLIIAFGVIFILSDRVLNLNDKAKQREENSASGFRGLKCKMTGREYYTVSLSCGSVCAANTPTVTATCTLNSDCGSDCCCPSNAPGVKRCVIKDNSGSNCNHVCLPNTVVPLARCSITDTTTCCCKCGG
ncbi:MAG: hypothetical protein DRN66_00225 [Candidatus Nanohalarchaeota archaeon]|nr:MAG: hypothetical protein DRN66_00225 [Candidatus Nanohaloarchaeota archaeon]